MQSSFDRSLAAVLMHEGGYSNHPQDKGGPTNRGITIATFRKWMKRNGTVADLKAISDADVAKIYRRHYWDKVRGDELPSGVDYAVFDYAVNSGPGRAAKHLQEVVGVPQDGIIGPVTIAASGKPGTITALCDRRMRFLRSLAIWDTFGKGWSSRVLGVRQLAHELATEPAHPAEPKTPAERKTVGILTALAVLAIAVGGFIAGLVIDVWNYITSLS